MVEDGTGEVPLVQSHAEALEETITRSPENTFMQRAPGEEANLRPRTRWQGPGQIT